MTLLTYSAGVAIGDLQCGCRETAQRHRADRSSFPSRLVHVRQDGPRSAPVVVLLHGFASSMHSFDQIACPAFSPTAMSCPWTCSATAAGQVAADFDDAGQAVMVLRGPRPSRPPARRCCGSLLRGLRRDRSGGAGRRGQPPGPQQAGTGLLGRPGRRGGLLSSATGIGADGAPARRRAVVHRASRFAFAPCTRAEPLFDRPGRRLADVLATAPAVYRTVLVDRPTRLARRPPRPCGSGTSSRPRWSSSASRTSSTRWLPPASATRSCPAYTSWWWPTVGIHRRWRRRTVPRSLSVTSSPRRLDPQASKGSRGRRA